MMSIVITIGKAILSIIYGFFKLFPAKNKVIFLSRQSDQTSLDMKMLEEEIARQHPDWQTVYLCRMLHGGLAALGYCFHMIRQLYHLATSRIAILDSYCIPVSLLHHRKCLLIIQMWHSVGTMKKFGHSILDHPEGSSSKIAQLMHMHRGYDYIFASSESYKDHLASGFACDRSIIKTYPLPRVEKLKDKEYEKIISEKIYSKYPELDNDKTNIVYAPTFRKGNGEEAHFNTALKELAGIIDYDRYNLIIKAHPLAAVPEIIQEAPKAIIDSDFSSFDMLFVCDILISDYSCFIYEAAVRDIPIYFYTYDYDHYMSTRDIYMDFKKEVPGPICFTAHELASALESSYDMDKLYAFRDKYITPKSPQITKDMVDFMFSHLK